MTMNTTLHTGLSTLSSHLPSLREHLQTGLPTPLTGLVGFDGFVDTFIRLQSPASMAEFGPKVSAAAGIAASFPVRHLGDKFGGNGPLFARALHDITRGQTRITCIGALGDPDILPLFHDALASRMTRLVSLANPARSECLEFTDGKLMLGDLTPCADITWERLLERMGEDSLNRELQSAAFISAVNWGKLPHAGTLWANLAARLRDLGRPPKSIPFFMDLAEFEHRPKEDLTALLDLLPAITRQCHTLLSFNLKEAWQLGAFLGKDLSGQKEPPAVAELAAHLHQHIRTDRIIIHPNSGAASAGPDGTVYVPGPFCREPLISTGAGDNFGAGCLTAALLGLNDTQTLLLGNATSGHFVRSGRTPSLPDLLRFLDLWESQTLPERL